MIRNVSARDKGDGYKCPDTVSNQTVAQALKSLIIYEFGYGGRVTNISHSEVSVVTHVMNCKDTTTFTGAEEEMKLMVEASVFSMSCHPMVSDMPESYKNAAIDQIMAVTKGNPLLIKMGADLLLGKFTIRSLLIVMLAQEEIGDPTILATLAKLTVENLFEMMIWVRVEGQSLASVLEIVET